MHTLTSICKNEPGGKMVSPSPLVGEGRDEGY